MESCHDELDSEAGRFGVHPRLASRSNLRLARLLLGCEKGLDVMYSVLGGCDKDDFYTSNHLDGHFGIISDSESVSLWSGFIPDHYVCIYGGIVSSL